MKENPSLELLALEYLKAHNKTATEVLNSDDEIIMIKYYFCVNHPKTNWRGDLIRIHLPMIRINERNKLQ